MIVTAKTKGYATIAIAFFAVSAMALTGVVYLINRAETELHESRVRIAENESYASELASLEKRVAESEAERMKLATFIIEDDDDAVINLVALIESIGREEGVELVTKTLDTVPLNGNFEEFKIELALKGSYPSIIHILSILESLPYQSRIEEFTCTRREHGDEGEAGFIWEADATLFVTKYKTG